MWMHRKSGAVIVLTLLALCGATQSATAASGDLDPSFGVGGLSAPPAAANYSFSSGDLAVQPDGKIVTAGFQQIFSGTPTLAVQRYNPDGTLDTSFGTDGVGLMSFGSAWLTGKSIALQPDGKIVVGGEALIPPSTMYFMVARFNADGTPDNSFDGDASNLCGGAAGNGVVCTQISPAAGSDRGNDLELLPDGRIALAGSAYYTAGGFSLFAAARYSATGALDAGFDTDGRATYNVGSGGWDSWANKVSLQTDGKLVLAGGAEAKGPNWAGADIYVYGLAFLRVNTNGSQDSTFHSVPADYTGPPYTIGTIISPRNHWTYGSIEAAELQPDGKLLAAGYANNVSPSPTASSGTIVRLTTDGALDTSWGASGRVHIDSGGSYASFQDLALDPSGDIYVGGYFGTTNESVGRLTSAGTLDTTFAGTGLRTVPWESASGTSGLRIQPDGKLLALGGGTLTAARTGIARFITARDPIVPPPGLAPPFAKVISPSKKSLKRSKLKSFAGTAGPTGSVKKVEIALRRIDAKLLSKDKRCLWLNSAKAKFKKVKATKKKCSKPTFKAATGTDNWKYKLSKSLPAGKYELSVKVTLTDGQVTTKFTKAAGTFKAFKLTD